MRWSSHHARLKRTSAVFCQSLTLPHELRSRSGRRKKDSRTKRCNGCVGRTLLKICVFLRMFLPPALHCSRKISMFSAMEKRHFSGTLVVEECQSVVGTKMRHQERRVTHHSGRERKEVKRRRESPPISSSHCDDGSSFRRTLISICSTKSSSHTRHSSRAVTPLDSGYAARQRL